MKVVVIIAIKDEQDLESGHKRKKAGDIIAVCPYPHEGGRITRKTHLLIPIELQDIDTIEDARKLMIPHFEDGELWYPEEEIPQSKILARNRYKIPLNELTAKASLLGKIIDWNKVLDEKVDYQPLEDKVLPVVDLIYDKVLNKKIASKELTDIKNIGK